MHLTYTNELEVSKIVVSFKNKKSSGHDCISNEILKSCSTKIEKDLVGSFNNCIEKQFFLECLKITKVLPLFKKGDESLPCTYRPINHLSSLCEIFEKLLYKQMIKFFYQKQSLYPSDVWFQNKIFIRSCICRNN